MTACRAVPNDEWWMMNERLRRRTACVDFNTRNSRMRRAFPNTKASPTKSQRICEACEGLHMVLAQGRYLLFRRATRRNEKPCCASFFPSMPTERLLRSMNIRHSQICLLILGMHRALLWTNYSKVSLFVSLIYALAQIRHPRGRDCGAVSSSRRGERICKISVLALKPRWQSLVHVVHQRTLAEHGDVPVRWSVHDCATSGEF